MINSHKKNLEYTFQEWKDLNNQYIVTIESIKNEMKDTFFSKSKENIFRFALSLHLGTFIERFTFNQHIKGIRISDGNKNDNMCWLYDRHDNCVGFVCDKKYLLSAIVIDDPRTMKNLWIDYCKSNNYDKSLGDFIEDCSSNKIDLKDIYIKFKTDDRQNFDDSFCFEIIQERKVKIKDIVVTYKMRR